MAGATRTTRSLVWRISRALAASNMSGVTSVASPPTRTACTRNLSRQSAREGGGSRWACMMTCTSFVAPASTMPEEGRTQYFLGEVVLTLGGEWGWGRREGVRE